MGKIRIRLLDGVTIDTENETLDSIKNKISYSTNHFITIIDNGVDFNIYIPAIIYYTELK